MPGDLGRTLRFARSWVRGAPDVRAEDIMLSCDGSDVPATLHLPPRLRGAVPGWVVLHDITRPGPRHPELLRFARALASTPAAVLIPEVSEWMELRIATERTIPTIRAAVLALDERPETTPGSTGLIGFSFGATQALIAAAAPGLEGHLEAVAGFGGYCEVERTLRFQFTGVHEWEGREHRTRPDPYGRWILGANFLPRIPGMEEAEDVAGCLRALASDAGDRRIEAGSPVYDERKRELRRAVAPERRELFDLFAPPSERMPDPAAAGTMVRALSGAAAASGLPLDPLPHLEAIHLPVRLIHGRGDRLIPWSETMRLRRAFPAGARVEASVTGLFGHSARGSVSPLAAVPEGLAFLRALRRVLRAV